MSFRLLKRYLLDMQHKCYLDCLDYEASDVSQRKRQTKNQN